MYGVSSDTFWLLKMQFPDQNVTPGRGKIAVVETLRGVASLFVLFCHWGSTDAPGWIQSPFLGALLDELTTGVYIFFAISGFIMPYALYRGNYRLQNLGSFVLKRIVRLDPPYLLAIVFCLLVSYLASLHPQSKVPFVFNSQNLFLHLLYLCPFFGQDWVTGGGGGFWTLGIEFQYYLILALIFPLLNHSRRWVMWSTLGLFTCATIWDEWFRWRFILPYTPFFAMGIITFWYYISRIQIQTYLVTLGLLTVLAIWKFEIYYAAGAVGTALLIAFYRRPYAPLQFFGKISYSLYLFHAAIALRVVNYCTRFEWGRHWNWLIILCGCAACIGLASLVYYLVERPSRDYSQRIRYKQPKFQSAV
ncbi:MAG: acyltransferase [Negativicutes bacterium]|nr:acyltransferase [Negativicutes bacterium]